MLAAPEIKPPPRADAFAKAALNVDLHPGQVTWIAAGAQTRVGAMGRRWGKSFAAAVDLIRFAAWYDRTTQFLVAPTQDQTSVIFNYVETLAMGSLPEFGLTPRIVRSPFQEMTLQNGSVIKCRSAGTDGKYLRGHGADRVYVDEAAFVPRFVLEQVIPPMLAQSRWGHMAFLSTPFGLNYFWEMFKKGLDGEEGYASFQFPSSNSPFVSRDYLQRERQKKTAMAFAVEYEAEFSENQASVFDMEAVRKSINADIDEKPKKGHEYALGFDPAKWSDRSGVVILDIAADPWQVVRIKDISGRDYTVQAQEVKALAEKYNGARVLLDATTHDQMLEQLRKDKVRADGFKFTNTSKQELITALAISLEQGKLDLLPDPRLLQELQFYRYELTAAGNVRLGAPDGADHHDDLVTALALAVWCASRGLKVMRWA